MKLQEILYPVLVVARTDDLQSLSNSGRIPGEKFSLSINDSRWSHIWLKFDELVSTVTIRASNWLWWFQKSSLGKKEFWNPYLNASSFLLTKLRSLKISVLQKSPENSATFPEYLRPRPSNFILLTVFQNKDIIFPVRSPKMKRTGFYRWYNFRYSKLSDWAGRK